MVSLDSSASCSVGADHYLFFYSYACICFGFIHGLRRSVSVDFCNNLHTCLQGWRFFICYPLLRILSRLLFAFNYSFLLLAFIFCVYEEKLFFNSDIWGKCGHFNGFCLDTFPDFETYLLHDFEFLSGEERKLASVLTEPAICAILKMNCNT